MKKREILGYKKNGKPIVYIETYRGSHTEMTARQFFWYKVSLAMIPVVFFGTAGFVYYQSEILGKGHTTAAASTITSPCPRMNSGENPTPVTLPYNAGWRMDTGLVAGVALTPHRVNVLCRVTDANDTRYDDAFLTSLDAATGRVEWTAVFGGDALSVVASPLDGGMIFATVGSDGLTAQPTQVVALEASTGREKWRVQIPRYVQKLAVEGSMVLVSGRMHAYVLDAATGSTRWSSYDKATSTSEVVGHRGAFADTDGKQVLAIEEATDPASPDGTPRLVVRRWEVATGVTTTVATLPPLGTRQEVQDLTLAGSRVIVGVSDSDAKDSRLVVNLITGAVERSVPSDSHLETLCADPAGTVMFGDDWLGPKALDVASGQQRWFDHDVTSYACDKGKVTTAKTLYIGSSDYKVQVAVLDLATGKTVSESPQVPRGKEWSPLAQAGSSAQVLWGKDLGLVVFPSPESRRNTPPPVPTPNPSTL